MFKKKFDFQIVEEFLRRLFSQFTKMTNFVDFVSKLMTLITFALQSSKILYQTIESFKNNRKIIRNFREELKTFDEILQSLTKTATNNETHFDIFKFFLFWCDITCKDFETIIIKCTAHFDESKTNFRDWVKLIYMSENIIKFRNMLAKYKITIDIALDDANM